MNKKILYAVAACTVLFSSCGGANGKPSTADANAIIEYNNTSLEVLKSLYSERETNNVLEYMEKHGKTLFAPVIVSKIGVARDTAQMTAPRDCFSSGVRDSLKTNYSAYFTAGEKFFANYDASGRQLGFEGITVGCGVLDTNPVPPYELLFVMARSLEIAPPIVLEVERAERRDLQVRRKGVDDFSLFHRSFLLLAKIRYHRPQTSAFSLGF